MVCYIRWHLPLWYPLSWVGCSIIVSLLGNCTKIEIFYNLPYFRQSVKLWKESHTGWYELGASFNPKRKDALKGTKEKPSSIREGQAELGSEELRAAHDCLQVALPVPVHQAPHVRALGGGQAETGPSEPRASRVQERHWQTSLCNQTGLYLLQGTSSLSSVQILFFR